jgi:hypothetical protein
MASEVNKTSSKKESEKLWNFERKSYIETVERLGVSHEEIAEILNISMSTYKSALQPSRPFPKWARAFIIGAHYQVMAFKKAFESGQFLKD